ncbi:hypothetical protein ACHAXA_006339 [Cyclostephanos tholiformis]|uniref:Uncharacterized protein n=1 Tax=Cyclostephanos tholiformis TaxID=382380 RepID=A0ABD3RX46_9STRA
MKGLHLTIDSWRPFRGADGFKLRGRELEVSLAWGADHNLPCRRDKDEDEELLEGEPATGEQPPLEVTPVPRLLDDLDYLQQLTEPGAPPRQLY